MRLKSKSSLPAGSVLSSPARVVYFWPDTWVKPTLTFVGALGVIVAAYASFGRKLTTAPNVWGTGDRRALSAVGFSRT